ncbi:hypothetical protein JCM5350_006533 [Sporobolomyces pararoseus]
MKREIDSPSKIKADEDQYYSDAVEELAGLGISEEQAQPRIEPAGSSRTGAPPAPAPSSTPLGRSPPSPNFIQPASSSPSAPFSSVSVPPPAVDKANLDSRSSGPLPRGTAVETEITTNDLRQPSLSNGSPQTTTSRNHQNIPGTKAYFPLVSSPSKARSPDPDPWNLPSEIDRNRVSSSSPSQNPPLARSSIFPTVKPPSSRPPPSNVFPLVKSPSSTLTGKTSANPFPFAEPPLSPVPQQKQRRPSVAPSTTSSSGSSSKAQPPRVREPSLSSSSSNPNPIPRSPSASSNGTSIGRAPSIASTSLHTTRSPSRTTYAPSIAPSSEGPTSIFATPVGYKPARSLAGLILTKPSSIVNSKSKEPPTSSSSSSSKSSKFSFLSSSKRGGNEKDRHGGVTAPAHLVAGPQRSTSNRLLDAALTTSQTWAIRRGEQLMGPASPAFPGGGGGGGGGATFAYRPGHQIRREQEAAEAARNAEGVGAEELAGRLEAERDKALFSNGGASQGSVFPTVKKA